MAFAVPAVHQLQNINMKFKSFYPLTLLALVLANNCYAVDSYRYLHVTIDTPWTIFLFLLGFIFAPFVLMAILVWRYSEKKSAANPQETETKKLTDNPAASQESDK